MPDQDRSFPLRHRRSLSRRLREKSYLWVRPLLRMTLVMPLLFSATAAWLVTANGQVREVLQTLIEAQDVRRFLAGLVAFSGLGWLVFSYYLNATRERYNAARAADHFDIHTGASAGSRLGPAWRNGAAYLAALLPLVGIFAALLAIAASDLPTDSGAGTYIALLCILTAVVAMGLAWLLRRAPDTPNLALVVRLQTACVVGLSCIPLVLPPASIIGLARFVGPLALLGVELAAAFGVLAGLVWLCRSSRMRWTFAWWSLASIVCLGIALAVLALRAGNPPGAGKHEEAASVAEVPPSDRCQAGDADLAAIQGGFEAWRRGRRVPHGTPPGLPDLIVAAEGGGIYAASATAHFLARARAGTPNFEQRLFMISAVSGGAVGAAIYAALEGTDPTCTPAPPDPARLRQALRTDHLSPLLAVLVPDVAITLALDIAPIAAYPARLLLDAVAPSLLRDWEARLEGSADGWLRRHLSRRDDVLIASLTGSLAGAKDAPLEATLEQHWCRGRRGPALLLNTTNAETGEPKAFSPFAQLRRADGRTASLAETAVASARFPLVLPPLVLANGRETLVDGAYSDNSGAYTVARVYDALRHCDVDGGPANVKIALVTSEQGEVASRATGPSLLVDLVTPLKALFNVRARLGAREIERLGQRFTGGDTVITFPISDKRAFLGWLISQRSLDIIEREIGGAPAPVAAPSPRSRANTAAHDRLHAILTQPLATKAAP